MTDSQVSEESAASVLLVDDVHANLFALEAVLEPLGLRLVRATSGAEALARAAEEDFALVLMDVQMPVLDGYETTRVLHERLSKNVPVIFVTAIHHDRDHIQRGYAVGGVDYLSKPIDPDVLKAKVQSFVELYRRDQIIRQQETQIRERALAAAAAEAASRAKDEFLGVISHELRTPLNAIVGWAETLDAERVDGPTARSAIKTILRNARAQSVMIDELVAFSEMVAGRLTIQKEVVNLAQIVTEMVDSMRPTAEARRLRLEVALADEAWVSGEASRLRQIVLKLLSNAVKFSDEGGLVEVSLERVRQEYRLVVRDHGLGIRADYLPYVFEGFRQAVGGYARPHGGLGIGLALAHRLVELHDGTIRADSDGAGRGTVFTVRLPAVTGAATAATGAEDSTGPALERISVLVVDDEIDSLEMMAGILGLEGAQVHTASSAGEALALLQARKVDVVVSDLSMPGEDGFSLMANIRRLERARRTRIPVIALSAHTDQEVRQKVYAAGFSAYLAKPCSPPHLCATIVALSKILD